MMDDFKKFGTRNESSDPLPQAPFSEGGYGFGAVFRLTHRVRGTEYKIGDRFTYISESDSVAADPYILKIGVYRRNLFLGSTRQSRDSQCRCWSGEHYL